MSKKKIELNANIDVDSILNMIIEKYKHEDITTIDGVKINFNQEWVHLRKSNTEPIIRVYTESTTAEKADALASKFLEQIRKTF